MKLALLTFFLCLFGVISAQTTSLRYPKNNQVVSDTNILFQWDEYVGPATYQLQIASDSFYQNIVLDSSQLVNSSLNFNLPYGVYYTRVKPLPFSPSPPLPSSPSIKFTIFSPKSIDSLVLWLAAGSGITKDANNKVSQWNDLSGFDHNALQSITAKQPLIEDSIIGSNSALTFIGGDYILSGSYSQFKPSNINRCLFLLNRSQRLSGYNILFSNFNNSLSLNFLETTFYSNMIRLWLGDGNSFELKNFLANFSNLNITSINIENSRATIFKNSVFISQGQYSKYVDSISHYAIGGRTSNGSNISQSFNGKVFEIIDYAKPLDSAQIQLVNKYLLDKYTPPINLGQNILRRYGFCDTTLATKEMYESYLWSTGDTTRSINISKEDTGWYWCEVPNLYGDIMRDSVYVYDLVGRANLVDTAICFGDSSFITLPLSLNPTRPYAAGTLPPFTPQASYTYIWKNSQNQIVSTDSILQTPLQDTYSLKITDTLGCFITDTVQVLVDSFEVQASLGPDTSLCSGDKIGLLVGANAADSFLWNNGSGDSLLVITNPGTYNLQTWNSIGCMAKDTITVAIHGITPYVAFSADTVCFRDSTLFIDSSQSLDQSNLINWEWSFGDNSPPLSVSSSLSLPHLYPDSGNYIAKLTVSTDSACSNYAYRNVYVRPLPEPDFYPLTACQNLEITFDNLTLHKDSLVAFFWDFGNGDTALQTLTPQAPYAAGNLPSIAYIYSQSGQYNASLTATDIYGCKDSIIKQVDIKPSPSAQFSYSSVCEGSSVSFSDQSQTLPYNPIMTYLWDFGGGSFSGAETPSHLFLSSGYYPTQLKVTALNACWDTITLPVKVNAIPQAGFSWQNACSTSPIQFIDTSVVSLDTINSWSWNFDHGWSLSGAEAPTIIISDTLIHHATLRVKSSAGCEDSTAQTFKVYPSPTAAFTMDREYGLPPLTVNFTNWSLSLPRRQTGGVEGTTNNKQQTLNSNWQFGDGFYSNQENPSHIYTDSNIFHPQLLVENTYGCKDSISHTVYVVYAAVDIAVTDIVSSQDQGYARFSCVIENRGQQKIKAIDLTANYNGGQPIQEQWTGELFAGQKINYVFQAKIKLSGTPAYYCITAMPLNTDIEDESPANNTLCKEYQAQLWVGSIYPNPATDFVNIDVILPVNQEISLSVSNIEGKQLQSVNIKANRGLNQLKINTTSYPAGTYQLKIESGTDSEVRRFIIL